MLREKYPKNNRMSESGVSVDKKKSVAGRKNISHYNTRIGEYDSKDCRYCFNSALICGVTVSVRDLIIQRSLFGRRNELSRVWFCCCEWWSW